MMKMQKNVLYIVQGATIAALYVALTYAQELLLPGTTSMAIQFRGSELLCMLALFTPAAIPGLTIGCVLTNVMNTGALPIDMVIGPLATLLATLAIYRLRKVRIKKAPVLSATMPALFNGLLIGWEIEVFFIGGSFHLFSFLTQAVLVAVGELGVLFILGIPFAMLLEKRGLDQKLFSLVPHHKQ